MSTSGINTCDIHHILEVYTEHVACMVCQHHSAIFGFRRCHAREHIASNVIMSKPMVKRIRGNAVQAALLLQGIHYPMPQQEAQVVSELL